MKIGIHENIPIEEYHKDPRIVSASGLKMAKKSSRHFGYYVTNKEAPKAALDFGNAFETALLDKINGTKEFAETVIILDPENRPDKTKGITARINQDWKNEVLNCGKYVIKAQGETESLTALDQMVASVMSEPLITELLTVVDYQKSFIWKDEATGLKCKTRPDIGIKNKRVILDIKTTKDASPRGFARECANFDYPLQAIMQIEGAKATGYLEEVDEYFWLAIEKTPPYNAVLFRMQAEDRDWLRDQYEFYLKRCAEVLKDLKTHDNIYLFCNGYNENADNKYGVLDLELPLFYK